MLYATKQKLYHTATILVYIVVFIAAVLTVLFAIFGSLIPGNKAYAAVKCSYVVSGSTASTYFFVNESNRVNAIASLNGETSNVITHHINFKNYRIEDAVKHFYENVFITEQVNYKDSNSRTFDVAVFTNSKFETNAKDMINNITKTSNAYFKSLYKKYSVDCSLSTNVSTVIYEVAGINYTIEGETQFEIDENKFTALSELAAGVRATKKFTPGNRQDFLVTAYNAKKNVDTAILTADRQTIKDAKKQYDESTKSAWESEELDSDNYKNEKYKLYDYGYRKETLPLNTDKFNTYIDSYIFEFTSTQKESMLKQITEYQQEHSTMYDTKTYEEVVYESTLD